MKKFIASLIRLFTFGLFRDREDKKPYIINRGTMFNDNEIRSILEGVEKLIDMKFSGERIIVEMSGTTVSEVGEIKEGETIAYTYYLKDRLSSVIVLNVANCPPWVLSHEIGHSILNSNGIKGHPMAFSENFQNWVD